jgi:hypothetical protein
MREIISPRASTFAPAHLIVRLTRILNSLTCISDELNNNIISCIAVFLPLSPPASLNLSPLASVDLSEEAIAAISGTNTVGTEGEIQLKKRADEGSSQLIFEVRAGAAEGSVR